MRSSIYRILTIPLILIAITTTSGKNTEEEVKNGYVSNSVKLTDKTTNTVKRKYKSAVALTDLNNSLEKSFSNFFIYSDLDIESVLVCALIKLDSKGIIGDSISLKTNSVKLTNEDRNQITRCLSKICCFQPARLGGKDISSTIVLSFYLNANRLGILEHIKGGCEEIQVLSTDTNCYIHTAISLEFQSDSTCRISESSIDTLSKINPELVLDIDSIINLLPKHYVKFTSLEKRHVKIRVKIKNENSSNSSRCNKYDTTTIKGTVLAPKCNELNRYLLREFKDKKAPNLHLLTNRKLSFAVRFIVEKNGSVSDVTLGRENKGEFTNKEQEDIIRIFKNLPQFEPGTRDNVPVKVRVSQSITLNS